MALFLVLAPQCGVAQPAPPPDWPAAIDLVRQGKHNQAVPFLERLVSRYPKDKEYRFELALALFNLGRDGRARSHLELVRGASLSEGQARAVSGLIEQIDRRRLWSGWLKLNLQPESNATRQTKAETISINGTQVSLDESAIGRPSTSILVQGGAGFHPHLTEMLRGRFTLDASLQLNPDKILRDYNLTARAGMVWSLSDTKSAEFGILTGARWLADRLYSRSYGVSWGYATQPNPRGRLRLIGELSRTRHEGPIADANKLFLQANYSHATSANSLMNLFGFAEGTKSDDLSLAGKRFGIGISGIYAFRGGLIGGLHMGLFRDTRDGPGRFQSTPRKDHKAKLSLSLHHRDLRIGAFAPELNIGIERNKSNVALADYANRYISIGVARRF